MKITLEGSNDNYSRGTLEMRMVAKPAERTGWLDVRIEPAHAGTDMESGHMTVRARDLWALGEAAKTLVLDEGKSS